MTDDEDALVREVAYALEPVRTMLERMMTLLERLTDRVEVLELERLHARRARPRADRTVRTGSGPRCPLKTSPVERPTTGDT